MFTNLPWQMTSFKKVLADQFNYEMKNEDLFLQSLAHRSFIHERKIEKILSNERLEFLGDAVLDLIVIEKLYEAHDELSEGELSPIKSALVNEFKLSEFCQFTDLDKFLLLGKGEEKNGGRERSKNLSRVFEALIGAMYLDSSYKQVQTSFLFMCEKFEKEEECFLFSKEILENFDSKSELQEKIMKHFKTTPIYKTKHMGQGVFKATCWIGDKSLGFALSSSKKKAEKELAKKILENKELFQESK